MHSQHDHDEDIRNDNNNHRPSRTCYNNKKILLARAQDKIYATDGIYTHEYADLSNGFLNEEQKQ